MKFLNKLKFASIGTLLTVGVISIIGVMISASFYSTYLSNRAQTIIRNSTTRIFDVLTIQRDFEELFSTMGDIDVVRSQRELDEIERKFMDLLDRAKETVERGQKNEVFTEDEAEEASRVLGETLTQANEIIELKGRSLVSDFDKSGEENYQKVDDLNQKLIQFRNTRFQLLSVFNDITMRSDQEFRDAMDLVQKAQMVTWFIVVISLILAVVLGVFLVRSVKRVFDLKNEFVNIIAHDLRNPVTAITGYLEMVSNQKDKKISELGEDLLAMTVSAQKLRSQINNLLEVGRTEAGRQKLYLESVDPFKTIEESVIRAKALAKVSGITIDYKRAEKKDVYILADRSKLSDVLDNLISNAIKYNSEKGTVTIKTESDESNFRVSVSDTGKGIPDDQKDRLFKRYSRLNTDKEKKVSGTGLGLYTVKLAMDQMKGTIGFDSKEGKGTTFTASFKRVGKDFKLKGQKENEPAQ